MNFLVILSTLRRHRTAALLIVLEIALTCAIVCNAMFVIGERLTRMHRASGVAEDELVRVHVTAIGAHTDARATTEQDLAALRTLPGVKYVANASMVPFGTSSWNNSISAVRDDPSPLNASMYLGSPDLLETLGVNLVAGRDFTPEEYLEFEDVQPGRKVPASVIVTRALADRLFPGQNPIGKPVYSLGQNPQIIVGVIEALARANEVTFHGADQARFAMVFPVTLPFTMGGNYLLRVDPARRGEVLAAVDRTINKIDPGRIILARQTFPEIRRDYFKQDRAMAYLLVGVSLALLVVTALGIVGLASFWVQQRTRQIGIRRALGATRGDILRYFQVENFLLATTGIVVGMGLTYAINQWLMATYEVPRLPAVFLPVGAIVLWGLGQLAVLGPARRASAIPPAVATRSV